MVVMDVRRLIAIFVTIIVVIFGTILIFSIDWGGSKKEKEQEKTAIVLTDYAQSEATVSMYIRGDVNSDKEHQDLRITVGRDEAKAELINGYQNNVKKTETTPSNPNSYRTFLSALINSGITKTQPALKGIDAEGACPTGNLYRFSFADFPDPSPGDSWATSCGKKMGTFGGSLASVKSLFIDQIPEDQFDRLTENTDF